jgi:proteasome lid subunit RPN8/RPN11
VRIATWAYLFSPRSDLHHEPRLKSPGSFYPELTLIMTISIDARQLQIIYTHAENIYPEECCGILLGKIDKAAKIVVEVIPTINGWEKTAIIEDSEIGRTKNSRYTIPPQDIFQAQKRGRDMQLEIVGFFHSHPDYPAIPSTCDRDLAWSVYSYPIVSVINGKVSDLKSWVLDNDGEFQPEEIQQVENT